MLVLNLIGGPGAGKSTLAAHVFAEMKWEGVNCELVTEAAKDWAWEGHGRMLDYGQVHLLGEQYRRLKRLEGQVDLAVTDSPLLLSYVYAGDPLVKRLALGMHREFDSANFLVRRVKEYRKEGRFQEEPRARELDGLIEDALQGNKIRYKSLPGVRASVLYIVGKAKERMGVGR